jgi:hypothetical protein
MTTRVRVEIVQENMPVVVEVLDSGLIVSRTHTLKGLGATAEEYVHSDLTLRVREMTTAELHNTNTRRTP